MARKSAAFTFNFDAENARRTGNYSFKDLRRMLPDVKKSGFYSILLPLCCIGQAITFVQIPVFLGDIIDLFINKYISSIIKNEASFDYAELSSLLIPAFILLLLNVVFSCMTGMSAVRISSHLSENLRNRVFEKIGKTDMTFLDSNSRNSISEIMTSRIDIANQNITLLLTQDVAGLCTLIAILIRVFSLNTAFGILFVLTVPLVFIFDRLFKNLANRFSKTSNETYNLPDSSEVFANMTVLHCSGISENLKDLIVAGEKNKLINVKNARFRDNISRLPSVLQTGLFSALFLIIYVYLNNNGGDVTLGLLLSMIVYLRKIETPISDLSSAPTLYYLFTNSVGEIYDFLEAPDEKSGKADVGFDRTEKISLTFDGVTFAYKNNSINIISEFNCEIPDSGITVINGVTGAGKTTVLKLLLGYYQPQEGTVRINGLPIKNYNSLDYRQLFSVITQESTLFETSVLNNIIYPNTDYDEKKLNAVLELLNIDIHSPEFPDGLRTACTVTPPNFSDGQIQRLLIARALYCDRRFLIFDESFSHMDNENEADIFNVLKKLSEEKGIILISHRDTAGRIADNIINVV